ncbi:ABC-three component system middle component 2 [Asticcacaulis tiandongensis]|uniref:ABC-three component system middle component 2 n=1 Tax=Asticcacaulis tiandongensis TaxID=2565365 RepID=UPI00112BA51D|nr:ABC-three component system middle component 2 [Asticcacaulis tiandongensis]
MDEIAETEAPQTFNGALEAGVRAVAILEAAFPKKYDLQRLTALDYLLIRTNVLGGPPNLHPETPVATPATEVRHKIVQGALMLMMTRDLIERHVTKDGLYYSAGETATMFMAALQSPYLQAIKVRAEWLARFVADYDDDAFNDLMSKLFADWIVEFQSVEHSLGTAQ